MAQDYTELADYVRSRADDPIGLAKWFTQWAWTSLLPAGHTPDPDIIQDVPDLLSASSDWRSWLMISLFAEIGVEGRVVNFNNVPFQGGHTTVELKINGAWMFFDPTFGLFFEDEGGGDPVSIEEARAQWPDIAVMKSTQTGWVGEFFDPASVDENAYAEQQGTLMFQPFDLFGRGDLVGGETNSLYFGPETEYVYGAFDDGRPYTGDKEPMPSSGYTWRRVNDTTGQTWSTYLNQYDPEGRLDTQHLRYDNLGHRVTDWDQRGEFDWSTITTYIDGGSQLDRVLTEFDDGSRSVRDNDQLRANAWTEKTTFYDALNRPTEQTGIYDTGGSWRTVWDATSTQSWISLTDVADADGRASYRHIDFDTGFTRRITFAFDDGGEQIAQTIASYTPNGQLVSEYVERVQTPFFSDEELAAIRDDPNGIATLYAERRADFVALLNDAMASMPEEYLKLSFTTVMSYELTPYGAGIWSNDLATLLDQPTMMCRNYCDIAWQLYNMIAASPDADIALVGWNRGAVGNHAQLIFALPGQGALLADPTIGLFALTDGYNDLVAGSPIAPDDIATFFWREEQGLSAFNDKVENALIDGAYRAGSTIYWYETTDYLSRYSGSAWNPGPQREALVFPGESNNLASSTLPNRSVAGLADSLVIGGVGTDILQAHTAGSVLFGGTASLGDPNSFGIDLRSDAFFDASEIAAIAADPASIAALYNVRGDEFAAALGSAFLALTEDQRKLAFSALLAHEANAFSPSAAEAYTLADLLAAPELTADSYAHLAWLLFQQLSPDANPDSPAGNLDIVQIGWNGGASGRGAQLLFNTPNGPSLLVDTALAHFALVSGFNALVAGEMVPVSDQISLLNDASRAASRDHLITALHDGLMRAGDMLYWFEAPDDVSFFFQSPGSPPYTFYDVDLGGGPQSWSSPQGEEVLYGADVSLAQGALAIHDTLFAGAGVDTLSGDCLVYNDGVWGQATEAGLSWWVGDFDGDGKDDAFSYNPGLSGAYMYVSTGGKFESVGSWTGAGKGAAGWYVGDFNGDGKDDIFRYMPGSSGADMFLSTGERFAGAGSWTSSEYGTQGWYVGDFNGDGKDDIFRYVPGSSGADMFLSSGTAFTNVGSWTGAGSGVDGWYIGDFNGDGMGDIMRYMPGTSGGQVFLSTGSSFAFAGSWTGAGHGKYEWSVQDVNGDGLDDLVGNPMLLPYGSTALLSTGASFVLTEAISPYGEAVTHWKAGDFNGDGITDFIDAAPSDITTYIGVGVGREDEDRFVFTPGMLNNDTVLDFQGAGVDGGDELWFRDFGAPTDMSIANIADVHGAATDWWLVTNMATGEHEQFRLAGVYDLVPGDYIFAA